MSLRTGHSGVPWTESRCTIASVQRNASCVHGSGACTAILLKEPCWNSTIAASKPGYPALLPSRIENVLPSDSRPLSPALAAGRWYMDRTEGSLYFWPTSNATRNGSEAFWVVGRNASLIHGAPGLRGHSFTNIAFELGGSWLGHGSPNSAQGFVGYQAAYHTIDPAWGAGFHCVMWHNRTEGRNDDSIDAPTLTCAGL